MKQHSKGMDITLWIATVLAAALFFVVGGAKIGGWADAQFIAWGYSTGFAVLIGVLEVLFAIGLLIKRTAAWASFGLMAIMLGAIGTHLTHGEYLMMLVPIAVFVVLGFIAWGRGPERADIRGRELRRGTPRPPAAPPREPAAAKPAASH
jgi:putative oxidoreductase